MFEFIRSLFAILISPLFPIPIIGSWAARLCGVGGVQDEYEQTLFQRLVDNFLIGLAAVPWLGRFIAERLESAGEEPADRQPKPKSQNIDSEGLKKIKQEAREIADEGFSYFRFLLDLVIVPMIWLRDTIASAFAFFWEDEAGDVVSAFIQITLTTTKYALIIGAFSIPAYFVVTKGLLTDDATVGFSTYIPFVSKQPSAPEPKQDLAALLEKYSRLVEFAPQTNLEQFNVLGERIDIANKLFDSQEHKSIGESHLLDSSIEFALTCFKGDITVPTEIVDGLSKRAQDVGKPDPSFVRRRKFSQLVYQIARGETQDWTSLEALYKELVQDPKQKRIANVGC